MKKPPELQRGIFLPDIHNPENIDLEPLYDFLSDYKPHIVIIGGDFNHFDYLSKWSQHRIEYFMEDKPRGLYDEDMKRGNAILDKIDKYCANGNVEKHWLDGNHEYRKYRLEQKFPDKKRTINDIYDFRNNLRLKERGYKWYPYTQTSIVKKGNLYFMHGYLAGKYHAEKYLGIYHQNMRYGHTHDIQIHSDVSPIDHHERKAMSCGCLCHVNADYAGGRANKWQNAFLYFIIPPSGICYEYLVDMHFGKEFRAEGKEYRVKSNPSTPAIL